MAGVIPVEAIFSVRFSFFLVNFFIATEFDPPLLSWNLHFMYRLFGAVLDSCPTFSLCHQFASVFYCLLPFALRADSDCDPFFHIAHFFWTYQTNFY